MNVDKNILLRFCNECIKRIRCVADERSVTIDFDLDIPERGHLRNIKPLPLRILLFDESGNVVQYFTAADAFVVNE
jgi:hypothetical protein